jgi:hypothetical protein
VVHVRRQLAAHPSAKRGHALAGLVRIGSQNEPVVTSKCASGRPLLIDSALPTEFRATRSKQRTEKFLTGARTHIRIFNFSRFTTQNPAQLIHRRRHQTNPKRLNDHTSHRISNRNWPANRSCRKQTIKPLLTETRITHLGSRNRVSTRFWSKSRSYRKQTSKPSLPGATTALSRVRRKAMISPSREATAPCWKLQRCCGRSPRRDTMDVQPITRLSPGRSPL